MCVSTNKSIIVVVKTALWLNLWKIMQASWSGAGLRVSLEKKSRNPSSLTYLPFDWHIYYDGLA